MLQGEHSAILLTFIKLLFVINNFVLPIFKWPFYTGFTVICLDALLLAADCLIIFEKNHSCIPLDDQSVKQFQSRSGPMFC